MSSSTHYILRSTDVHTWDITILDQPEPVGWVRKWGGTGQQWALDVVADNDGYLYVAGVFDGASDFDPGVGESVAESLKGETFIVALDANGDFQWMTQWQPFRWYYKDGLFDFCKGKNGEYYIVGTISGDADMDPGHGTEWISSFDSGYGHNNTSPDGDAFLMKLTSDGKYRILDE